MPSIEFNTLDQRSDHLLENDPRFPEVRLLTNVILSHLIYDVVYDELVKNADDPKHKAAAAIVLRKLVQTFVPKNPAVLRLGLADLIREAANTGDAYLDALIHREGLALTSDNDTRSINPSQTMKNCSRR